MTKASNSRKGKKGVPVQPTFVQIDPATDAESVEVETLSERWTECKLVDGTVIRVKPIIVEVRKTKTIRNPTGEPIYFVKSQMITDTQVNPVLKENT